MLFGDADVEAAVREPLAERQQVESGMAAVMATNSGRDSAAFNSASVKASV